MTAAPTYVHKRGFGRHFWTFLFAENLYDFGMYVYYLLFNLYLLDWGYRENFLGWLSSAMTAGSIAGTLPAPLIIRRFGLKPALILASAGVALLCAVRTLPLGQPGLIVAAFLTGLVSSCWAVSLPPMVAALTSAENRPLGFSLWTGWGIGLGIVCGLIGGRMPGWMQALGLAATARDAKQLSLLIGCTVALTSPLLLIRVAVPRADVPSPKLFQRSPFLTRYLIAFGVWNLAMGAFNPFFSAYFSRHLHMPVDRIGVVFSASHVAQIAGVLLAPMVLRRVGTIAGIASMQLGAAVMLGLLAAGPSAIVAGGVYACFMAFQYMSEPGTFTLLMNHASPEERSGVSALSFFVTNCSMALSAGLAGMAVTAFGYPAVLTCAALTAAVAAGLFYKLLAPHSAAISP